MRKPATAAGCAALALCVAAPGCGAERGAGPPASPAASGWSQPAPIPEWSARLGLDGRHRLAELAADRNGGVHALLGVGGDGDRGFEALYHSRFDGSRWSDPTAVAGGAGPIRYPRLGVDREGRAHVLWYEHRGGPTAGGSTDLVHRFRTGRGWSPAASVYHEAEPEALSIPSLAVASDCRGAVWAAYANSRGGTSVMSWTSAGWGAPVHLHVPVMTPEWSTPPCAAPPTLVFVASGLGGARGRSANDVYAWTAAGGTPAPEPVHRSPGRYSHYPHLLVDGSGTRHAVWLEDTDGELLPEALLHATSRDGRSWTPARDVTPPALRGGVMWAVRVAPDAAGRVHVAVHRGPRTGPRGAIYAMRLERGRWSAPELLVPPARVGASELLLAPDARGGGVHAVWRASDGLYYRSTWSPALTRRP